MKAAVPVIVAGLVLMLLGIGLRTVWEPAETVTASVAEDMASAPVTVILPGVRGQEGGDVEVRVDGDAPFTLAVGRASDVEAWVGGTAHLSVTGSTEDMLSTTYTDGGSSVPDPRGSDLWISEETTDGSITYRWAEPVEGDWSILLASDGKTPAPTQISVTRPNDRSTPPALPLIIGGALVVVLGLALLFVVPRDRSGKRASAAADAAPGSPRDRARETASSIVPPVATLVVLVATASLLVASPGLALAPGEDPSPGTTPDVDPSSPSLATGAPSPGRTASGPPVVVERQLERILGSVASTVADADTAADPALLASRAAGAALELRTASYAIGATGADVPPPAPVAAAPLLLEMIPTGGWPRALVALTQGDDAPVPQALLLVQETPRENYRLTSAVQMLPGSTFPTPPLPGAAGTIPLDEAGALKTAPQEAVVAIADVLTDPSEGDPGLFEENSFAEAITGFQDRISADPGNRAATISFRHAAQDEHTRALLTGDGGAMVFGYLTHTYSSVPTSAGAIDLGGTVYEELTGQGSSTEGIDVRYGEAVMLYVPPAGSSDPIRVVGADQHLVSAELR